jgi:hypothetical protein
MESEELNQKGVTFGERSKNIYLLHCNMLRRNVPWFYKYQQPVPVDPEHEPKNHKNLEAIFLEAFFLVECWYTLNDLNLRLLRCCNNTREYAKC